MREVTARVAHPGSYRKNGWKQAETGAGGLLKDTATTVMEDKKKMCFMARNAMTRLLIVLCFSDRIRLRPLKCAGSLF